ncbi:MAG: hypothetical protein HGA86_01865 [Anaerolineaceae bacterium]|nr:hypothetical protein [Anaerolineaceae bacterium]
MKIEEINNHAVESFFRSMRSGGKKTDSSLLLLSVLELPPSSTMNERSIKLADLLISMVQQMYIDLRLVQKLNTDIPTQRSAILERIHEDFSQGNPDLEAWSALFFRYGMHVQLSVEEMAAAASVVPQQFRRRLNSGLTNLVNRLQRMEMDANASRKPVVQDLPLPEFTQLVGVSHYFEQLNQLFARADGPLIVSLEGMGGIGKTALARAYTGLPDTRARWTHILWVSARQYVLAEDGQISPLINPATTLEDISIRMANLLGADHLVQKAVGERMEGIRAILSQESYLVVVDNLETVPEYIELVPALAKCAGLSRFIITTRQTLRSFPYVHTLQLSELNSQAAYDLIQSETGRRSRSVGLDPAVFDELYRMVGGLPLAIKLVAAQLPLRPAQAILDGFRNAKGGTEGLYRYLYWQTWQMLSDTARRLLLTFLPSDPEGENLDFLQLMSGISAELFYQTIQELDRFSLLEINGETGDLRYRLHRLTITFLQTDILKIWENSGTHASLSDS